MDSIDYASLIEAHRQDSDKIPNKIKPNNLIKKLENEKDPNINFKSAYEMAKALDEIVASKEVVEQTEDKEIGE